MNGHLAVDLLRFGLLFWLGTLVVATVYRLLNGGINVSGLLAQDVEGRDRGDTPPERVQFIVGILFAVLAYALQVLSQMHGTVPLKALPEVPQNLLLLFAGSHVIYLSGKLGRTLRN